MPKDMARKIFQNKNSFRHPLFDRAPSVRALFTLTYILALYPSLSEAENADFTFRGHLENILSGPFPSLVSARSIVTISPLKAELSAVISKKKSS